MKIIDATNLHVVERITPDIRRIYPFLHVRRERKTSIVWLELFPADTGDDELIRRASGPRSIPSPHQAISDWANLPVVSDGGDCTNRAEMVTALDWMACHPQCLMDGPDEDGEFEIYKCRTSLGLMAGTYAPSYAAAREFQKSCDEAKAKVAVRSTAVSVIILLLMLAGCAAPKSVTHSDRQSVTNIVKSLAAPMPPKILLTKSLTEEPVVVVIEQHPLLLRWPALRHPSNEFVIAVSSNLSNWIDVVRTKDNSLIVTNVGDYIFFRIWEEGK